MQELNDLIGVVNKHLELDLMMDCRFGNLVLARKVYYKIAKERGFKEREIGNHIGIDRTTVIYHLHKYDDEIGYDTKLLDAYTRCRTEHLKKYDTMYQMDNEQLKSYVDLLKDQINDLTLEKNNIIVLRRNMSRLMPLFNQIIDELPYGYEQDFERQVIPILRSLKRR